jgi:hypothetical protein
LLIFFNRTVHILRDLSDYVDRFFGAWNQLFNDVGRKKIIEEFWR